MNEREYHIIKILKEHVTLFFEMNQYNEDVSGDDIMECCENILKSLKNARLIKPFKTMSEAL